MLNKYFKPKSVTWWASFVSFLAGVIIATEPLHNLSSLVLSIQAMTGEVSPFILINAGAAGIGLRGAV